MSLTQSSDPERVVPTRRISFDVTFDDIPKHFATDGNVIDSHLTAMLSSMFPDGEDFFVRSVRHYRNQITDPALRQQVSGFIGQEAVHGREHRDLNARFAELGYPTRGLERLIKRSLELRTRYAPAITNLAATAALEHFTATMAETLLSSEELGEQFGHEGVRNLFLWHALEESEHKAVAFDVYRAVGGSERIRIWTMRFLRYSFIGFTAVNVALSMARDPAARNLRRLRRDWRAFTSSPLVSTQLWEQLKEYERPGFHPSDRDTTALEARWRERLFGDDGTLNDLLATKAA
jgi:predicted metal-dependent hydrolase